MAASAPVRDLLLDCAQVLFLAQGFESTSMEQVRLKAGASNGSLYHQFPTRGHLARATYERALARYHAHMLGALNSAADAHDGVQQLVKRHIAWVLREPQQARVLHELRPYTRVDGIEPDWSMVNGEAFGQLKAWIAQQVASGAMHDLPFPVWIALVFSPVIQLTPGWVRSPRLAVAPRVRKALAEAAARSVCTHLPLSPSTKGVT